MFPSPTQASRSQQSRSPAEPSSPRQQQQLYADSTVYAQHPPILRHPPTPSGAAVSLSGEQQQQQAATPGAFAPTTFSSVQQPQDLLHPPTQRARSSSLGQPGSTAAAESQDPKRSNSLNDTMSNPQTYYPMASPMGGYPQPQLYGQGPMAQSGYYPGLPQSSLPISSSYIDPPRQSMPQMQYYNSPSMQYGQSSYPDNYATSYGGNNTLVAQSYGSPIASQQYPRPAQPAPLAGAPVQVVDRAKKPQCWEHGCNGREFSTFSNLLRHQREKSGTAAKSYCPHCGAEFTRTTARNGHMEHGKCKTRRATAGSSS